MRFGVLIELGFNIFVILHIGILYPPFSARGPFQKEPCESGDAADWKRDKGLPL